MKNPYITLNIHPKATLEQIKAAYKKMSKKTHPDKGGNPDDFIEVKKAYDILSDPIKRKMYDDFGTVEDRKIEQSIYNDIHQMFFTIIANNPNAYNSDMIGTMVKSIDDNIADSKNNILNLDLKIDMLQKYKGKIKLKPEHAEQPNIFEELIEAKIQAHEKEKDFWRTFPEKLGKLREVVLQYESKVDNNYNSFNHSPFKLA